MVNYRDHYHLVASHRLFWSLTVIVPEGYHGQNIRGCKPESLRAILPGLRPRVHTHCSTPTCSKIQQVGEIWFICYQVDCSQLLSSKTKCGSYWADTNLRKKPARAVHGHVVGCCI